MPEKAAFFYSLFILFAKSWLAGIFRLAAPKETEPSEHRRGRLNGTKQGKRRRTMTSLRTAILLGFFVGFLLPVVAFGQTSLDGTWKLDVSNLSYPKRPLVWLVQYGIYECRSCVPPIRVSADGHEQRISGQSYDTISIAILDGRTIRLIQKKSSQIDSDEKFTVSADGKTATDEFGNWKISMHRIADAPPGSHLMSGTWQPFKIESSSDRELLFTFEMRGDTLAMSRPTGQSYRAKLNGSDSPYFGEPRFNGVAIKGIDANTIEENDKFDGRVVIVSRMSVTADGKSMNVTVHDLEDGSTAQFTATRQ
jgi:hypothetical protein